MSGIGGSVSVKIKENTVGWHRDLLVSKNHKTSQFSKRNAKEHTMTLAPKLPSISSCAVGTFVPFFLTLPFATLLLDALPSIILPPFVPLFQVPALGKQVAQNADCANASGIKSQRRVVRGSWMREEERR